MLLNNIVEIQIQGEQTERFLNMCIHHNIKVFNLRKTSEECCLHIYATDFFLIKDIVKKSGMRVKILQKKGLYFKLKKYAKKKLFFVTAGVCLLLLWISSGFLWGIKTEGNQSITEDLIIDYLQENGIYYGMPLRKIPIDKLKTNLRNAYEEITWVSIYLEGAFLHISIKENDTVKPDTAQQFGSYNLIAVENGIVDSVFVRQGTSRVKAGDEVSKGDILISGEVEIIAEDGTVKDSYECKADGDVWLIYNYPVEEQISFEYLTKEYTGNQIRHKNIYYENKELSVLNFKIPYLKYDAVTENINYSLFNILSLPISMKQTTYREYQMIRKKYNHLEAQELLNEKLDKIFLSLEEKGVQIIEKNVKISSNSACISATGNLIVKGCCTKLQAMEENK